MKRALIVVSLLPLPAFAQPQSESRSASFDDCLRVIRDTASRFKVTPVNIVETTELRIVRFNTADGSVLISCSKPDKKMVVTMGPHRG